MKEWLLHIQHPLLVLGIIYILLIAGAIGLPIPEDVPLILGGIISHTNGIPYIVMFSVCYLGVLTGDLIIFFIGRWLGPSLFEKEWFRSRVSQARMKRIRVRLEKRSLLMIFIARHLFYLRSVTFLVCGAVKMELSRFLISDAIAALVSVPLMLFLGHKFAEHYALLMEYLYQFKIISIVIAVPIIGYVIWKIIKHRKPRLADTENQS